MAYTKTTWVQGSPPYITASTLNHREVGIDTNHKVHASFAANLSSYVDFASTLGDQIFAEASFIAAQDGSLEDGIAHLSTSAAVLSTQAAVNATQSAIIASDLTALATELPLVATHGLELADMTATSVAHSSALALYSVVSDSQSTSLSFLATTQASQIGLVDDVVATQQSLGTGIAENATAIDDLTDSISAIGGLGVIDGLRETRNPIAYGPLDLRLRAEFVGISHNEQFGSPITLPGAKSVRFVPVATLGHVAGVKHIRFATLTYPDGQFDPTGPGEISAAILDASGNVMTAVEATLLPSGIPTTSAATWIVLPFTHGTAICRAGQTYYLTLSHEWSFVGLGDFFLEEPARILWSEGLAYNHVLPSGHNLASYTALPLNQASSMPPATNEGLGDGGLIAAFVDDL